MKIYSRRSNEIGLMSLELFTVIIYIIRGKYQSDFINKHERKRGVLFSYGEFHLVEILCGHAISLNLPMVFSRGENTPKKYLENGKTYGNCDFDELDFTCYMIYK